MVASLLRKAALLILVGLLACGGQSRVPQASPSSGSPLEVAVPVAQQGEPQAGAQTVGAQGVDDDDAGDDARGDLGPLPVTAVDPSWGSPRAPATLVVFSDLQCPFCSRLAATLEQLKREYGPQALRIVWKNQPLPFHADARPAAVAGQTVFRLGGAEAFWRFHDLAFRNQRALTPENFEQWASMAGVDSARFSAAYARQEFAAKVDDDIALAKTVGANGTPTSFINGVLLSGAQPVEAFRSAIDDQTNKANALIAAGTPRRRVYALLAAQNYAQPKPAAPAASPSADLAVYKVPIAGSPVRGKAGALVTMVVFSDFQCPFCARVEQTVKQVEGEYGDKLRIVWKNNPLPFHPRAEPAAELALEVRAQKGDAAFWKVHDVLFGQQSRLSDQDLEAVATSQGLNAAAAMRAVQQRKHKSKIEEDQELADDLKATGTPHFFINGRRLVGAQPIEKFREIIDEQLVTATALVQKGTPAAGVYDAIQKNAITADPLDKKSVPAPTKDNPSRGPQNAKVTIQIFGDFQCPFCKRVLPTLTALDAEFPGKIRFVWRNLPLAMHKQSAPAAEAAMEAYVQKGATSFWAMHDLLFQAQDQPGGLERQNLEQLAQQLGLDTAKFRTALDTHVHAAVIEADTKASQSAGISGTPAFVINGYFVSGAQPLAKFKRVVQRALKEAK
jgi:protein-disulfide isomerase